jgi:hypothetical protein
MKAQVICRADGTIKAFRIDVVGTDPMHSGHLFPAASEQAHEVEIPTGHRHLFKPGARTDVARLKAVLGEVIAKGKVG